METKIYVLCDETGLTRYVGRTYRRLEQRLSRHLGGARHGEKGYRNNWIRSMLSRRLSPSIVLLEEVEGDGCSEERAWIAYFRARGVSLVNMTDGGEGLRGMRLSKEHRKKISEGRKGYKVTEATKKLIREARKHQPPAHTTPHTEQTKALIRQKLSDPSVREKIGAANRGRKRSATSISKMRASQRIAWTDERRQRHSRILKDYYASARR